MLLPRLRSLRFSLIFFSSQKFCSFRFYIYVSDSLNFCINCETLKLIFFLLPMEFFLLQYRLQKKLFFLCGIAYVPCQKSAGSVSRFSVLFINLFVRPSAGIAKPLLSLYDMSWNGLDSFLSLYSLLQCYFSVYSSFAFLCTFQNNLLNLSKTFSEFVIGIVLNLFITLWHNWCLSILSLSVYEYVFICSWFLTSASGNFQHKSPTEVLWISP